MLLDKKFKLKNQFGFLIRSLFQIPFFEKPLVSFLLNYPQFNFLWRIAPYYFHYKHGSIRICERNDIKYTVDISYYIDWYIYYHSDRPFIKQLNYLTQEGDIVFDVGSNIGEVLLNLAKKVGTKGFVHGFEPHPDTFYRLSRNLKMNFFSNCKINNLGLGNIDGYLDLVIPEERDLGTSRIRTQKDHYLSTSAVIKITTLDNYCQHNNCRRIDLIKLDVEGYEHNVLMGGEQTVKTFKPKLFVELNDQHLRKQGSRAIELVKYIHSIDYATFRAGDNLKLSATTDFDNCHWDILCMPN